MIRMGRGSESNEYSNQTANDETYRYANEASASTPKAISESDSMARDIKEGRLSGFVGHGTTLSGETQFQAMLRVDGHLVGTVTSDSGTLIVGTNGQVDANVSVAAAMINGTVNGDVITSEKLQLGRTARVMGNIQSPRLIVEEGAILEGSCSMIRAMEAREKAGTATDESSTSGYSATTDYDDDEEESQATLLDIDEDDEEAAETAKA